MMAVDVGNTQTVLGLIDGEEPRGQWRIATEAHRTADELAVREGWREVPPDAWIPAPDAAAFGLPAGPAPRRPPSGH